DFDGVDQPRDAERVDVSLRRLHPRVPDSGAETAASERLDIRNPNDRADDRDEQEQHQDPRRATRPSAAGRTRRGRATGRRFGRSNDGVHVATLLLRPPPFPRSWTYRLLHRWKGERP